ncbi:nitrous oxide reductase accessory protein NosL [Bacillus sp. EB106-08-02-XG196]|jgi:copper chaperone NosL|uniref:nitrous oxide reductase accessory protein NosL n=1 Tax=Bacillus sp. EB106-08-02-XG196 TaxID=2737049 RepID=UPI0015C4578B|nr:nitrous oxide reductase accessory protein NosL [Bacillus sp. EB106-08-02-XG196]NWQ42397.1 nitrous oxide reductase accessory protein NosL [Bacillus sp. EB106-08-02-XG196]
MNRYILKIILITILALLMITGCGKKEINPVAIHEETAKCEICNMQVKDNQFATEIILKNGKAIVFDDIGCMNQWMKENENEKVDAKFVRDYSTSEWIEMENATYVYGKAIKTPMAYNIISFTTKDDAQNFIVENEGSLLTYTDLEKHSWEKNKEMMEEMKKMKMDGHSEKEDTKASAH